MINIAKFVLILAIALTWQAMGFAAELSVSANVPTISGLMEVTVFQINAQDPKVTDDDTWSPASSIDFGTLNRDPKNKIFTAGHFIAVDVAVIDNTGKTWTITHNLKSVLGQTAEAGNLDENIVVGFDKVMQDRDTGKDTDVVLADPRPYKDCNGVSFNRAILEGGKGGWLRIYYGVATGNKDVAIGAVTPAGAYPVPQYQLAGSYSGSVTLTLEQK